VICGNGLAHPLKECDDGRLGALDNYLPDGCSPICQIEPGFTCPKNGTCTEICGQGTFDHYQYECDDGNNLDGDGCSATCLIERGYQCTHGSPNSHDRCTEICGDGLNLGLVWCDDGNTLSGDGCDTHCHVERGFNCSGGSPTKPDTCLPICGDGIKLGDEACDDRNLLEGDGCDQRCTVEEHYVCTGGSRYGGRDVCTELCGNRLRPNVNQTVVTHY
jgi:cysteine-rich repeat protein